MPIPGTKRRKYLEENCAAADVELTQDELGALDKAFPPERHRRHALPGEAAQALGI